ncbi:MAG: DUF504 domain-containing protein [Desulfobulbaceae bacterium]|nr:DUF504 domain-containing protein [Desulfobulbaceae bacterium]
MIPVHQLLSRIQWDREFGRGHFEIGYYDRVLDRIVRVPLFELIFAPNEPRAVKIMDREGVVHSVPLHRIKEVYKDNELIWYRQH